MSEEPSAKGQSSDAKLQSDANNQSSDAKRQSEPVIETRFNPLDDYIFFRLMGEKGDEEWLLAFINAVLEKTNRNNLVSVEIVENKQLRAEIIGGKSSFLDVRATTDKGDKIDIEVQLVNEKNFERRSLYYWAREYVDGINEGDDYKELPTVFAINIVNFGLIKTGGVHTSFHIREDDDRDYVLTDALEIHFLDMSKFRSLKNPDIKGNIIHRWLTYLNPDANESSLNEVIKMDTAIAKANEKMIRLTNDPEVVRAYDMRRLAKRDEQGRLLYARDEGMNEGIAIGKNEGIAIGKNEGIAIGKNEGIAIGKREIARSLKSLGSAPDFIAKATGLSLEEIEKL